VSRRAVNVSAIALVGVVAELVVTVQQVDSGFVRDPVSANYLTLTFAIVVATIAVGVAAARGAGWSGVGVLLVIAAAGAAIGYARFTAHPLEAAVGFVVANATALVPLHAGVSHREGVPIGIRRTLVGTHVLLALLAIAMVTTAPAGALDRWFVAADSTRFGRNPFVVVHAPGFARAAQTAWWIALLSVAGLAVSARYLRWRAAPRAARRSSAPVVAGSVAWTLMLGGAGAAMLLDRVGVARAAIVDFSAVAIPVLALGVLAATIGWVELVGPRLGRVNARTIELRHVRPADSAAFRALLADVLATPNVDLAFASETGWVDGSGRTLDLAADKRRSTILRQAGTPVAAILHEADVPFEAIELGASLAGAQLAAQRSTTLARSRADAVRLATGRLVRAGDRASATVSALLADQSLPMLAEVANGLRAGTCTLAQAATTLRSTTTEVRNLSHGLFPRDLEERGLAEVLGNEGVPRRRLATAVEMTCYLLADDDSGAVFTDNGSEIVVRRTKPPDRGLIERVEALGGAVDGTVATLPTGSG
jgi:hypothetical protein